MTTVLRPGRHGADRGELEVAEDGQREGAGYRRGGHHEEVGDGALARQREALEDAEAVLLVDDAQAKAPVLDVVGEEGLGAEDEVDLARLQRGEQGLARRVVDVAREEGEPDAERLEEAGGGRRVLPREELGRRHDRRLAARLYRVEAGEEGDERLARADVALEEPRHRPRRGHVRRDLGGRFHLAARELEGQALDQAPLEKAARGSAVDLGLASAHRPPGHGELEIEELLEDEARARRGELLPADRKVDGAQGLALGHDGLLLAQEGGQLVLDLRGVLRDGRLDDAPHLSLVQALCKGIDRQDARRRRGVPEGFDVEGRGLYVAVAVRELSGDDYPGADW